MVTASQPTDGASIPAGLLVRAPSAQIVRHFAALCALQPVRHLPEGLLCAPRAAPELAHAAMAACPLPLEPTSTVPGWPDPPSAHVSGWYRRSPDHAPAPEGIRELIQVPGEGFGPAGHATTTMCLAHLPHMPAGPAIDAGCGSGLLAQAWTRSGRGTVLACDVDSRALAHAARSLDAAGLTHAVELRRAPLEHLSATDIAERVILANIPAPGHHALLKRLAGAPPGVVLSGLRPAQALAVVRAYRAHGMRVVRASSGDGFWAISLVRT